ncbi:MAG: GNAT family N-acetyltransferase [Turicibacter sp.]|nr:GNAT family N-acetyltransferase [Turicibacter sp.]
MDYIYTAEIPNEEELFELYEKLGFNDFLQLSASQLYRAMQQSFASVYVYAGGQLVGTGRCVSDGVISAYLCGLGVLAEHRGNGVGSEIIRQLVVRCRENGLHIQLFCGENLVGYYEKLGFREFAVGMQFKNLP